MAYEQYLDLYNTAPNRIINRSYKDSVFKISFNDPDILADLEGIGLDISSLKYELKIIIGYGEEVAILKSPTGYFHVEQVLQDYTATDSQGYANTFGSHVMPQAEKDNVEYNNTPFSIHEIDKFSCNRTNLIQVRFLVGLSFYNTDQQTFYPATHRPPKNKEILSRYYYWNAVQQHKDTDRDVTEYQQYILDGTTKKFLTNQSPDFKRKVRIQDYQTLAFFNGKFCESANQGHGHNNSPCDNSLVYYMYCRLYHANGTLIATGRIRNNEDNGGTYNPALNSPNLIPPNYNPWNRGLLYVGVGPNNIIDNWDNTAGGSITSALFNNTARYEIFATGSGGLAQIRSDIYHFEMQEGDCKDYELIRLAYLNRQGAWDYMNFTKKSTRTTDITRSNFKQNYGVVPLRYIPNNPVYNKWDYDSAMGGTRTYNVNAIETIEANTDWLTEEDAIHLEELFTSPDVYMQNENNEFEPVVVTERDYTKQTKANDKLIQYVISVQKGHETRVQRL